jgi:hypothetical protein
MKVLQKFEAEATCQELIGNLERKEGRMWNAIDALNRQFAFLKN